MNPWRQFFNAYADKYDAEVFTHHTAVEVAFLRAQLELFDGARILDVGCGTGRHSVALAEAGCDVTGVDISEKMLAVAGDRAAGAGVTVEWVRADAVTFQRSEAYDAVICLCEGAMCLLTDADDALERDARLVEMMFAALRPGGRLILNVLNGLRMIRCYGDDDVAAGRFDPVNLLELSDAPQLLPAGVAEPRVYERGYTPTEIRRVVTAAGFELQGVYGGTAGDWGLRPPKLDEFELMVIARRPD